MENKLTIWIHRKYSTDFLTKLKNEISEQYLLSDRDFRFLDNTSGFKFTFDDETNGDISVFIEDHDETKTITISGTFDWEVVAVYQTALGLLSKLIDSD